VSNLDPSPKFKLGRTAKPLVVGLAFYMQRDTFKLAIQGPAMIADLIDDGIKGALPGGAGRRLLRMSVERRLELAESLAIISPPARRLILALDKIRNDFAHIRVRELTQERARALIPLVRALFDEPPAPVGSMEAASPHAILSAALFVAYRTANTSIEAAADQRARREAAFQAATGPIGTALASILEADVKAIGEESSR
jgi:hypothetical protein